MKEFVTNLGENVKLNQDAKENLKKFLYRIAFKKRWATSYQGTEILIENWWNIFLISGEIYSVNGAVVRSNFHWLPSLHGGIHSFPIEGVGECKVLISSKRNCSMGCHVLINEKIIGGDVGSELLFLPIHAYPPKEFDLTLSLYPSLSARVGAFLLDIFFITVANFLIYVFVFEYLGANSGDKTILQFTAIWQLIFNVILLGIVQTIDEGSVGKRFFKMRLVEEDLTKLSMISGLKRYFIHFISLATGGLGFLKIFFDKNHKGFHYLASGTKVVRADCLT